MTKRCCQEKGVSLPMTVQSSINWVNLLVPIILPNPTHRHRWYTSAYPDNQILDEERKPTRRLCIYWSECEMSLIAPLVWVLSLQPVGLYGRLWGLAGWGESSTEVHYEASYLLPDCQSSKIWKSYTTIAATPWSWLSKNVRRNLPFKFSY